MLKTDRVKRSLGLQNKKQLEIDQVMVKERLTRSVYKVMVKERLTRLVFNYKVIVKERLTRSVYKVMVKETK